MVSKGLKKSAYWNVQRTLLSTKLPDNMKLVEAAETHPALIFMNEIIFLQIQIRSGVFRLTRVDILVETFLLNNRAI